jgi:hypothetical protein
MNRLLLLALLALPLVAQERAYVVWREATLSSSAEAVTIQQPANPTRLVRFSAVTAFCSAACTITLERGGTAATSTALTSNALSADTSAATALAFHTSNSSGATVLSKFDIAAGGSLTLDLKRLRLPTSPSANVTLRTNSLTGSVRIGFTWQEE